jgi:flavin-dependent dehydrogenase
MSTPGLRPIEIVGGGLAGLSLGLALRRAGVPVTLHEAGDYPRHRVCGEFITALDTGTRARLGLDEFLADAIRHQEVAWFRRATPLLRHALPSPALALGRHALDLRLADAFRAAGGDLRVRSRLDPRPAPPGRVFAHGRRPAAADSPWLGLKCHALGLATSAPLEVHLGAHAYVGLCAIGDNRVNVSGLFRRRPGLALDRATALTAYLRATGLDALADRLAAAEIDPESRCAVAGLSFGRVAPEPRHAPLRLSLGDAHALIPPFTGNGMTMAFQSAALALDPLLAWTRGEQTWPELVSHVRSLLAARFRLRLASSALLHPAMLHPRGQIGLSAAARTGLLPVRTLYHALH